MTKMYSMFNRRENIFQPNLVRNRQPYSGPISSDRLNLFYDQFIVDVARLEKRSEEINSKIEEIVDLRSDNLDQATPGFFSDEDIEMTIYGQKISYDRDAENYLVNSATPYYEDTLSFYKPVILSSTISFLEDKLDILEKTINIE